MYTEADSIIKQKSIDELRNHLIYVMRILSHAETDTIRVRDYKEIDELEYVDVQYLVHMLELADDILINNTPCVDENQVIEFPVNDMC